MANACYRCGDEMENVFTFRGHEYCHECKAIRAAKTCHLMAIELQYQDIKLRHTILEFRLDVEPEGSGCAMLLSQIGDGDDVRFLSTYVDFIEGRIETVHHCQERMCEHVTPIDEEEKAWYTGEEPKDPMTEAKDERIDLALCQ